MFIDEDTATMQYEEEDREPTHEEREEIMCPETESYHNLVRYYNRLPQEAWEEYCVPAWVPRRSYGD